MFRNEQHLTYQDVYEYFGSTEIERIRKFDDQSIQHDWLIFDSVDEAMDYFNERGGDNYPGIIHQA